MDMWEVHHACLEKDQSTSLERGGGLPVRKLILLQKHRYLSWYKNRHWFCLNQNTMVFLSNVEAEVLYFLRWGMSEKH